MLIHKERKDVEAQWSWWLFVSRQRTWKWCFITLVQRVPWMLRFPSVNIHCLHYLAWLFSVYSTHGFIILHMHIHTLMHTHARNISRLLQRDRVLHLLDQLLQGFTGSLSISLNLVHYSSQVLPRIWSWSAHLGTLWQSQAVPPANKQCPWCSSVLKSSL